MKVRELIEFLKECDPEMMVVVDGYEGGVKELKRAVMKDIFVDYHAGMTYYGPHEPVDSTWVSDDERDKYRVESVVHLPR